MKTVIFLRAREQAARAFLLSMLVDRPWVDMASRIVVQMGVTTPANPGGEMGPHYDAVVELWSDEPLVGLLWADSVFSEVWRLDVRMSQEVVGKAGNGHAPVGVTPGLSQLSFIRKIEAMPDAEAQRHWSEHVPRACAIHVGMERYVQDRLSTGAAGAEPWFGMAHLHFPNEAALRDGLFRTPADVEAITADVAEFISDFATMLAVEHVVKG